MIVMYAQKVRFEHYKKVSYTRMEAQMQQCSVSDIARLKAEFELQTAAANSALHGLALGASQHKIITARMKQDGRIARGDSWKDRRRGSCKVCCRNNAA